MAQHRDTSRKKSSGRKYGAAAGKTVASAMRRKKKGTLKSGRGGKGGTVKSRKQAIAIGLSEARKKGAKVPRKRVAPSVIRSAWNRNSGGVGVDILKTPLHFASFGIGG